jgi:hypothetical protein
MGTPLTYQIKVLCEASGEGLLGSCQELDSQSVPREFQIDVLHKLELRFGASPETIFRDLLEIAAVCLAADRLAVRRSAFGGSRFLRNLNVSLPVRKLEVWSDHRVTSLLEELLHNRVVAQQWVAVGRCLRFGSYVTG